MPIVMQTPSNSASLDPKENTAPSPHDLTLLDKKRLNEAKAQELAAKFGAFKESLKDTDAIGMSPSDPNSKIDHLVRHVAEVEGKLKVSDNLAQFLQSNLSRAEDEQRVHVERARQLEQQLGAVRAEMNAKETTLQEQDRKCRQQAARIQELSTQIEGTGATLSKSYSATSDNHHVEMEQAERERKQLMDRIFELEASLEESKRIADAASSRALAAEREQGANVVDSRAQEVIADLEFRLSESNRMVQIMKARSEQAPQTSMTAGEQEVVERELVGLRLQLQQKDSEIAAKDQQFSEQSAKMDDLMHQIAELGGRLKVSNRLAEYLQSNMSRTEGQGHQSGEDSARVAAALDAGVARAEQEKIAIDVQAQDLQSQLDSMKSLLQKKDEEIAARDQTAGEQAVKIENLVKYIDVVEGRLAEANRVASELQTDSAQSDESRVEREASLRQLRQDFEAVSAQLREKEEAVAFYDERTEKQASKIEGLVDHVEDVETRLAESVRMFKILYAKSSDAEDEKRAMEAAAEDLRSQIADLGAQLQGKDREIESRDGKIADAAAEREELELKISGAEASLVESNNMFHVLQTKAHEVEEEKKATEERVRELESSLASLKSQLQETEESVVTRDSHADELNAKVSDLTTQMDELLARHAESEKLVEYLNSNAAKADQEKQQLEQDAAKLQVELVAVKAQLEESKASVASRDETVGHQQRKIEEISAELAQASESLQKSADSSTAIEETAAQAEAIKKALEEKIKIFQNKLMMAKTVLEAKEEQIAASEKAAAEHEAVVEDLQERIADLEEELADSEETVESLEEQAAQVGDEKVAAEGRVGELEAELASLRVHLNDRATPAGGDSQHSPELEAQLGVLKLQLEQKDEQIKALDEECRSHAAAMEETQRRMAETEAHLNQSYNDTLLANHAAMLEAEQEKEDLARIIDELKLRLQEAMSIQEEEGDDANGEVDPDMNVQLVALESLLADKDKELAARERVIEEKTAKVEDLIEQVTKLEGRLTESISVAYFLQTSASKTEEEKQTVEQKARNLQSQLSSATRDLLEKTKLWMPAVKQEKIIVALALAMAAMTLAAAVAELYYWLSVPMEDNGPGDIPDMDAASNRALQTMAVEAWETSKAGIANAGGQIVHRLLEFLSLLANSREHLSQITVDDVTEAVREASMPTYYFNTN